MSAPPEQVWTALSALMRSMGARKSPLAALLATTPRETTGDPGVAGSTIPGFEVAESRPPSRLVLHGSHRLSEYDLAFALESHASGTLLTATTNARFPGLPGRAYRALVIGSRGHALVVRRMIRGIASSAESLTSV